MDMEQGERKGRKEGVDSFEASGADFVSIKTFSPSISMRFLPSSRSSKRASYPRRLAVSEFETTKGGAEDRIGELPSS